MAEASLVGMPLELLVHIIATYLSTKDLGALRLTSKYFETALFDTFAKEFFTKKQFMLTTPSLDVLIKISKHGALAPFVKHVIIGLDQYSTPSTFQHWANIAQYEAYRNGWADQNTLTSSGRDREMLAEAFRQLPNLATLGIRDYSARGRFRDDNRWRSYGAPTVQREIGIALQGASSEYASRAYTMLLQALGDANKPVPSIEVILRAMGTGLSEFAFFLPPANTKMKPVLDGLQKLLLTLDFREQLPIVNPNMPGTTFPPSALQPLLETFLLRTSSLRHLRLNFQDRDHDTSGFILERFSMANNLLPNLQRLEFGMMGTTPDLLLQTVSKFSPKLRHFGLWKVQLTHSLLPRWTDAEGRFDPWPRMLQDLSRMPNLQLDSIMLGCLEQFEQGYRSYPLQVKFASGKISEEGSGDMKVFLPQLIDDLRVQWPAQVSATVVMSESDEDDDEEMEDEDTEDDEEEDE